MWKPFLNAVKDFLPQSEIIHDRFHLVKYLNDAIDKVRRREVRKHDELKNTKYIFLKNPEKLVTEPAAAIAWRQRRVTSARE